VSVKSVKEAGVSAPPRDVIGRRDADIKVHARQTRAHRTVGKGFGLRVKG